MKETARKMAATLKTGWSGLPAATRGLVLLAIGFAIALAGGAITAYGGTVLVLWLFVLAMGGLLVLMNFAYKTTFKESVLQDKTLLRVFLAGAAVGLVVVAGLLLYRKTIYYDDYINYYSKQELLLNSFASNGFYGVHVLAESLLTADYKMFLNLFISVPYLFTGRTPVSFMLSYYFTCVLPAWFVLLMVAKRVGQWLAVRSRALYYGVCMCAIALWPMQLFPATHGMPDQFGLVFAGIILLLCADYRFETLPLPRLAAVFAATYCLILTRRWYMYWILAFYLIYCAAVLAGHLLRRTGKPAVALRNMAAFGGVSALLIGTSLFFTFKTILSTDYADLYGSYYGGGFLRNLGLQGSMQGWVFLLAVLAGLVVGLCRQKTRIPTVCMALMGLVAMALFTHTQDMGEHQSLILAPTYLFLLFVAAAALCAAQKPAARVGAAALGGMLAVNCAVCIFAPGVSPLFSGIDLDTTRRTDLDAVAAVTDFVSENCGPEDTVYINIDTKGYSGTVFAYSNVQNANLRSQIVWEHSIPSTHGFPTEIWSSKYVMVTDPTGEGGLIDGVNTALRTDTPAAAGYEYVCELPLQGITLYCYRRLDPRPSQAETDYYLDVFREYDTHWPEAYSGAVRDYCSKFDEE